jgi:predicted dehydrogenase
MVHIAIIGLGNLGRRHLEALSKSQAGFDISLHDPSAEALALAHHHWHNTAGAPDGKQLVEALPDRCDLAIVATTAAYRRGAIEEFASRSAVDAWLVEKPLAQSIADIDAIADLVGARAWVNLARRVIPWHQSIARLLLADGGARRLQVSGGPWGLASNVMHFVDLMSWWSGAALRTVDTSGLSDHWHESKRAGYSEVFGTLRLGFEDGRELLLVSQPDPAPLLFEATTRSGNWRIDERGGVVTHPDGTRSTGRMLYQSELTGGVADSILHDRAVALPPLAEIAKVERRLLGPLIDHAHRVGGPADRLNIT